MVTGKNPFGCFVLAFAIWLVVNAVIIAGITWIVVQVLRWTGVL